MVSLGFLTFPIKPSSAVIHQSSHSRHWPLSSRLRRSTRTRSPPSAPQQAAATVTVTISDRRPFAASTSDPLSIAVVATKHLSHWFAVLPLPVRGLCFSSVSLNCEGKKSMKLFINSFTNLYFCFPDSEIHLHILYNLSHFINLLFITSLIY